jgi:hypothetical protein
MHKIGRYGVFDPEQWHCDAPGGLSEDKEFDIIFEESQPGAFCCRFEGQLQTCPLFKTEIPDGSVGINRFRGPNTPFPEYPLFHIWFDNPYDDELATFRHQINQTRWTCMWDYALDDSGYSEMMEEFYDGN